MHKSGDKYIGRHGNIKVAFDCERKALEFEETGLVNVKESKPKPDGKKVKAKAKKKKTTRKNK